MCERFIVVGLPHRLFAPGSGLSIYRINVYVRSLRVFFCVWFWALESTARAVCPRGPAVGSRRTPFTDLLKVDSVLRLRRLAWTVRKLGARSGQMWGAVGYPKIISPFLHVPEFVQACSKSFGCFFICYKPT